MAVISPDTFNPLRRYVSVRLQQGVPIVDADWNELDDSRNFELRAYLKWFVGNGIPEGNDGFRIDGSAALANDFIIRTGISAAPPGTDNLQTGLNYVGRCLVDGADVIIEADTNFTAQPLHPSQPGSAALASAWGVPQIQPLTTPVANTAMLAYLDVWTRLVTPTEDPALVHAGLGTESCARLKREWVVRVRVGATLPQVGDADYLAGHSYYPLAGINRLNAIDVVAAEDILDQREKRLLTPPATLISDVLGTTAEDYRKGQGRPIISLRDSINALLRGELPSTAETAITSTPAEEVPARQLIIDSQDNVWVFWTVSNDIFAWRLRSSGTDQWQLTNDSTVQDNQPMALRTSNGDIWVFWQRMISASVRQIWYRRYNTATRVWEPEVMVPTGTGRPREPYAVEDSSGDIWLVYRFDTQINAQRRDHVTGDWGTPDPRTTSGSSASPFALVDSTNQIWLFYQGTRTGITGSKIYSQTTSGGVWPSAGTEVARSDTTSVLSDFSPMAIKDANDQIWLFWSNQEAADKYRVQSAASNNWATINNVYEAGMQDPEPFITVDGEGTLWLVIADYESLTSSAVVGLRRSQGAAAWGTPISIAPVGELNHYHAIANDSQGKIWLVWQGQRSGNRDLYYKLVLPKI